ncbi:MAG: Asp-tRNA(Asn)/Glu-tRNA(Gln) amidotransferase subunit GatC [Candidatus Pacebacteria bacterium]|nr:Asp-tRNA(Asn)/Glu-tRNA(Gln) amidotransferase subunit GatC [Candidatus Paceibacterota bacterium]
MAESNKVSEEEVKHIAELARIELTSEEVNKFAKEISDVLGYVEQLKEVDTEGIEPISQVTGKVNVLREDMAEDADEETKDIMAKNYPDSQDGYIKVKQIF